MRHITYIILYIIGLFLCFGNASAQLATNQPKHEFRAVWLTTLNNLDWPRTTGTSPSAISRQKQELIQILDQLQAANFNAIVFQTRIRGTVLYPSKYEAWDACLSGRYGVDPGYDPLAFAIEECHKRGMQLHAWVVAIPGTKFAAGKALGSQAMEKKHPELCIRTNESYMLNPGVPATADYIASICEEITTNYDIDGISFDYIRYPEKEIKFSDQPTFKKYSSPGQSLADWRRQNMNTIVKTIHDRVKAIKPWVAISCSPVGKYDDTKRYPSGGWNAYRAVCQDAKLWIKEGWMDMLMPMMYFKGNHYFPFALDWQEDANNRCIATGLGVYLIDRTQRDWPLSIMESEICFDRAHGLGGQVFFRSDFVTRNPKGIYNLLRDNLYRTKSLIPPLAGDSIPTPQAPASGSISESPEGNTLQWASVDDCTYTIYRSNTYPIDTTNPANIWQTGITATNISIPVPMPTCWLPCYAVTAINRYGRESEPLYLNKPHQFIKVKGVKDL